MTVEEVFSKLISHMLEGSMYHEEMMKAYCFLGLQGYAKQQKHRFDEEIDNYNKLVKYYMTHYYRLVPTEKLTQPELIPNSWYKYSSQAVDVGTKRNAIKELMIKWVEWEKDTKKLYEEMYLELTNLREVAAAIRVEKLIKDVDKELSEAQQQLLYLETIGYDMTLIVDWQEKM